MLAERDHCSSTDCFWQWSTVIWS